MALAIASRAFPGKFGRMRPAHIYLWFAEAERGLLPGPVAADHPE
jgi:hypothetical protein